MGDGGAARNDADVEDVAVHDGLTARAQDGHDLALQGPAVRSCLRDRAAVQEDVHEIRLGRHRVEREGARAGDLRGDRRHRARERLLVEGRHGVVLRLAAPRGAACHGQLVEQARVRLAPGHAQHVDGDARRGERGHRRNRRIGVEARERSAPGAAGHAAVGPRGRAAVDALDVVGAHRRRAARAGVAVWAAIGREHHVRLAAPLLQLGQQGGQRRRRGRAAAGVDLRKTGNEPLVPRPRRPQGAVALERGLALRGPHGAPRGAAVLDGIREDRGAELRALPQRDGHLADDAADRRPLVTVVHAAGTIEHEVERGGIERERLVDARAYASIGSPAAALDDGSGVGDEQAAAVGGATEGAGVVAERAWRGPRSACYDHGHGRTSGAGESERRSHHPSA